MTARIAFALMLFAQAAMAWSACEWLTRAPERAVVAAAEHAGCAEMSAAESAFSSVCLAHCLAEKQCLYKAVLDIPAMPAAPVLNVALAIDAMLVSGVPKQPGPAAATGPPRRILFRSFQV